MPQHYEPHKEEHGKISIEVQQSTHVVVTNSLLIGFRAHTSGGKSCLVLET